MTKKYLSKIITIFLVALSIQSKAQSNYSVVPVPFVQYSGNMPISFTMDDIYSSVIPLPFNFDFYGNTYNQLIVSTNGFISFDANLAGDSSPWQITTTIPNANFPVKNSILGCFHDMDNSNGQGTITYGQYGTAPNRKFVIVFYNQSHFSIDCQNIKSSFQMILNEGSNIVDVQLVSKGVCPTWNTGNAVTGLINTDGTQAIAAPNRNTSSWTTAQEGWRFYRPGYYANYSFVKCNPANDGIEAFNLQVAINDLTAEMGTSIMFYSTLADAQSQNNALPLTFTNVTPNNQIIYASNGTIIKTINLKTVDCTIDADNDSVTTETEDVNADSNLANDDTDFDGIYNYLDNDDDGDLVLTNIEYVFLRSLTSAVLDTDNDSKPNYLDSDDDGDGILSFKEDTNNDGNPANDDTNNNSVPDYLENVLLNINNFETGISEISLYPNPADNELRIKNKSNKTIKDIEIYTINGVSLNKVKPANSEVELINVSNLQAGVYFVKVTLDNQILNYKFIKK